MDTCDVLIVGGGPAGSSCAWKLRESGLDVVVLDRKVFPRDKICGGWITPPVLSELEIDPREYERDHVLQPITAFRTGAIDGGALESDYGSIVSYGIRRSEFDHFLLNRSSARLVQGVALDSLARSGSDWIANGQIRSRMLVAAGGHFCPVARLAGTKPAAAEVVVAQETEFAMAPRELENCRVQPDTPELYFCPDLKGYGWCFRKQNFLNIGLGRMDPHRLPDYVAGFLSFLKSSGRISFEPPALRGHAYLLYGHSNRTPVDDGLMWVGDALGLAYAQSGEGILPAVQSGLMAGATILDANGCYRRERLAGYPELLRKRFGSSQEHWTTRIGRRLPSAILRALSSTVLGNRSFTRKVLLDRWFLHAAS